MQNTYIQAPVLATKTDSVIRHMQYKVDSLEKVASKIDLLEKTVERTEIGIGFFSEVIALQLALFLFIVGIAGWISWKRILKKSRIDRLEVIKETRTIFYNEREVFEKLINEQQNDIFRLQYNVSWTILKSIDASDHRSKFLWNISCASSLIARKKDSESALSHLKNANDALGNIENGEFKSSEIKERFDHHIDILTRNGNNDVLAMLPPIIERAYEIMYSKYIEKPPLY